MIVEQAHAAGKKVAAHAHGRQGIKNAVLAGVDSIEHGTLIDDEGIRLMKERGTYLVADIYNDDYIMGKAREFDLPQEVIEKERGLGQAQRDNFRAAHQAGVRMVFGSDAGVMPHGQVGRQFATMVTYGMTPLQAIQAATRNAAQALGREHDVGAIAVGRYGDLVAVTGDPTQNVRLLEAPEAVVKGGDLVDRD